MIFVPPYKPKEEEEVEEEEEEENNEEDDDEEVLSLPKSDPSQEMKYLPISEFLDDGVKLLTAEGAINIFKWNVISTANHWRHFSDVFVDECSFFGVQLFVEPAGSSDQVQALDVGYFGQLKTLKNGIRKNLTVESQTDDIRRIYNAYHKAGTPDRITSAFKQAGVYTILHGNEHLTAVDVKYARAVRGMNHESYETPPEKKKLIKICNEWIIYY